LSQRIATSQANICGARRVTHWQNGKMVLRWMASAFLRTEKRFKRNMGHRDLRALEAILNPSATARQKAA